MAHQAQRSKETVCLPQFAPQATLTNIIGRYNPVLGEFFRCRYDYANGTRGYYIAEQGELLPTAPQPQLSQLVLNIGAVSHHPPISAYFYYSPANHLRISGELKPKVRFLGNSVLTVMEGQNRVYLTQRPEDGGASTPWSDNRQVD